ncbi:MAG: ABC transporter ATP-binding protein [Candidimonas sp.]|nr:MAG: ABC transporter ATP-binding protein [Candidimonas sp.]
MTDHVNAVAAAGIDLSNVSLVYPGDGRDVVAVDSVSFSIDAGKFFVLVGPSGCGKSSLLMMMAGLQLPSSGQILCRGKPVDNPDPDRAGVVFQEANLYPWLTAQKNVEFPLMLKKVPVAERHRLAVEALELVELGGFTQHFPHQLSGGMKQRVSIARGLVQRPSVLLMDEPFAALDEQTRLTMGDELLHIWERTRQTIVFVTHSLTEAVYLADEVAVMSARPGRLMEIIAVPLPRPRTMEMMDTEEFGRLRSRIWQLIRSS